MVSHSLEMLQEDAAELDVSTSKVRVNLFQYRRHLGVAQRQDAGEDFVDTGYAAGMPCRHEWPHQHASRIGFDGKKKPPDRDGVIHDDRS